MSRLQFRTLFFGFLLAMTQIPAFAETVAIVGVTAHTNTQKGTLYDATVLIDGERILAVGTDVEIPEDARLIEATGSIVTPGFMNSASHLGLTEVSSVDSTSDYSVEGGPLGAAFDVQYALNANSELVALARSDGLARAVSIPERAAVAPFAGLGALLHLRSGPSILQQPRIGLFVEIGGQTSDESGGSRSAQWVILRRALDEAGRLRRNSRSIPSRDSYFSRYDLETLQEVSDGEMPLIIGADRESDIHQAIRLKQEYGIRIVLRGGAEAWLVADELAAASIPVVIDPSFNLPQYFDQLNVRDDSAAILQKAGVLISFKVSSIHTSYDSGFTLREVAGIAVSNGLDYSAALKALTINAAETWQISDHYGTLQAGKDADVVIWDGDPLEPSTLPVAIFVNGTQISQQTRQTRLRDRYHPNRN